MKRFVIYAVILGALAIPGLAQRPFGKHQGKGQRLGEKLAQLDKNGDGKFPVTNGRGNQKRLIGLM